MSFFALVGSISLVASLLRLVHSSAVSLLPFCECSSSMVEPVALGVKFFSSSFLLLSLVLRDAARGSCVFALFAAWPSPSVPTCRGGPSLLRLAEGFCVLVVMVLPCVFCGLGFLLSARIVICSAGLQFLFEVGPWVAVVTWWSYLSCPLLSLSSAYSEGGRSVCCPVGPSSVFPVPLPMSMCKQLAMNPAVIGRWSTCRRAVVDDARRWVIHAWSVRASISSL